jgi:DNA (cytosine-5)-methyltransferase 1
MKILNLYAGIGGNRKLWHGHEITAVEYDQATADVYSQYFPNDKIIVTDAHEYLLKNYMNFDFIWASPPCPSHSDIRRMGVQAGMYEAQYPDMRLYQEIILMLNFLPKGANFCIENVKPYYQPLIAPKAEFERHLFWANFKLHPFNTGTDCIFRHVLGMDNINGFDITATKIKDKRKALRNMVHPEIGLHILNCALNIQQPVNFGLFE